MPASQEEAGKNKPERGDEYRTLKRDLNRLIRRTIRYCWVDLCNKLKEDIWGNAYRNVTKHLCSRHIIDASRKEVKLQGGCSQTEKLRILNGLLWEQSLLGSLEEAKQVLILKSGKPEGEVDRTDLPAWREDGAGSRGAAGISPGVYALERTAFADDQLVYVKESQPQLVPEKGNIALPRIERWKTENGLELAKGKTESIVLKGTMSTFSF
ncbi:hypothetical protein JTB14_034993 [Gonioctena quinquepunctata]|nr:hypothetical protein JTB14_034993 [Gonioctena quinquepunctata]